MRYFSAPSGNLDCWRCSRSGYHLRSRSIPLYGVQFLLTNHWSYCQFSGALSGYGPLLIGTIQSQEVYRSPDLSLADVLTLDFHTDRDFVRNLRKYFWNYEQDAEGSLLVGGGRSCTCLILSAFYYRCGAFWLV